MSITAADLMDDLVDAIGINAKASSIVGWFDTHLPELNEAVSGDMTRGFPQGRMVEVFGPSSSGKTWIATLIMAAAQEQGGMAFFSDHERSFDPLFAEHFGLNLDPAVFKHLKPRTFEDSMELFKKAIPMIRAKGFKKPIVWVFDSVAAMIPRSKLETDKGEIRENADFNMRDKLQLATCCAQNYPILKMFAEDYNCAVIMLNQTRIDPSVMYGDGVTTPGGKAAEFYCDVRISLGRKDVKDLKTKELIGFEVKAKCIKNKIARPYREATWKIKLDDIMGIRVDSVSTNVEFAIRRGLIEVAGSYVVWEGKKFHASALIKKLEEDAEGSKKLLEMIYKSGEKVVEAS